MPALTVEQLSVTSRLVTLSPALAKLPFLSQFLQGASVRYSGRLSLGGRSEDAVLVWGKKPSAAKGEGYAAKHQLAVLRLEDGFLRSLGLGLHCPPYSVVLDDEGIYYDASAPSRLERLIQQPLSKAQAKRASDLMHAWQQGRVSKYNHNRDLLKLPAVPFVLVVDQTYGDASIRFGLADAECFWQMLDAALRQYPNHPIVLKVHPDVLTGKKRGHFDALEQRLSATDRNRVQLLAEDAHPASLLQAATAVFCVTSQMGFEALLWQKPVYTFGMPFYAGWGLTVDAMPAPKRRCAISLQQLIHAALIDYPRYLDPETSQPCEVETLLDWLALQRAQRERFPRSLQALRMPRWKKPVLRQFLQGSQLSFIAQAAERDANQSLVVWGVKSSQQLAAPLLHVEDGFIRSVGLGADLIRPASWVLDEEGIYYDATRPSALETMLREQDFSAGLQARAQQLIAILLQSKVTKYNQGQSCWQRPEGQLRVILIPGQVESDASIQLGSPVLKTNLALIKAVRAANPDAWLVYKPHPDVQAGLRVAGSAEQQAGMVCNEVVLAEDMAHLLTQVDEVHTLTSLTGFEALLRLRKVVCYGQPFYAGWGLTEDKYPPARRGRQRSLAELVAAALILYPCYLSHRTDAYATPELVIAQMQQQRQQRGDAAPWWRVLLRKLISLNKF
ncbi:capsular polysaccharide biosynthesis protein [Alkalimonas sp. MEB108]|uniref:Capsular polysaccharide biosynthesis protein n=1 Tax=Alkalimonas cellulosilytica TaxID=3058395 RepID=A0ABU7J4R8_9GAMM|nr:capsular polysaccharide biosynthesis protein [Alkalimonas sp. MEB108]MEE2001484.1 capsular polysaccharide biosynthesis protein [Alkalimonas sp. MEB108]